MWSHIDQFIQGVIKVEGVEEGLNYWIFDNGLLRNQIFRLKIEKKKVRTPLEMLSMALSYMILEEKQNTRFNNIASVDTRSRYPI